MAQTKLSNRQIAGGLVSEQPVHTYNIMNTKLKLILVFLGGVITTLLIEYMLRWQIMVILIYWFFR